MTHNTIYISLGTNEGDKLQNLQNAIDSINNKIGCIQNIAPIYRTASWGFEGNDFFNTCIEIKSYFGAEKVMLLLLDIEKELGRIRNNTVEYANRVIDLDVLLFNNETINSTNIIVPHPRMLDRKFVLVPLSNIANSAIHPLKNTSIENCLSVCSDNGDLTEVNQKLQKPKSIFEEYNYIAIEGNIGAGKTSLTNLMSADFNAKLVLEGFADNPFLPKFYKDPERYAFPLEMSFLAERYQQLTEDLDQFDLFKSCVISDYYIFKSLIFAQITLPEDEFNLYRRMFDLMYTKITKPDLYIYLYQNTERLLKNIEKRGRDYEQNIEASYLKQVHDGYMSFIKTQKNLNVLVIDVSELDFVAYQEDYQIIINKVKQHLII